MHKDFVSKISFFLPLHIYALNVTFPMSYPKWSFTKEMKMFQKMSTTLQLFPRGKYHQ